MALPWAEQALKQEDRLVEMIESAVGVDAPR